ncbi:hypothetical protein EUZ93_01500 [Wolbachia pipientis]|nr:hypothetical protein [Wolbachia pipientis]
MFKKPTYSGRLLQFNSNHPLEHKRGTIISQFDKILFLSHPDFHKKNITSLVDVLLKNYYPINFIFSTINNRLHAISKRKDYYCAISDNKQIEEETKKFFIIPYQKNISEKLKTVIITNMDTKQLLNLSIKTSL